MPSRSRIVFYGMMITMLMLVSLISTVHVSYAKKTRLFKDSFEGYATGSFPSTWENWSPSGSLVLEVTSSVSYKGMKSFHLKGDFAHAGRTFTEVAITPSTMVFFKVVVRISSIGGHWDKMAAIVGFGDRYWNWITEVRFRDDGWICSRTSECFTTWSANVWYLVEVAFDMWDADYQIKINGVSYGWFDAFPASYVRQFALGTGACPIAVCPFADVYFDKVKVSYTD